MSHNLLKICVIANFVAIDINTNMSHLYSKFKIKKTRVMLLSHPQGGKQKLGLQAHDYGPLSFFLL